MINLFKSFKCKKCGKRKPNEKKLIGFQYLYKGIFTDAVCTDCFPCEKKK